MRGTDMSQFTDLERFWKLAVVVIASGAIVMALEIVGSRTVMSVFGSTTYSGNSHCSSVRPDHRIPSWR